MSEDPAAYCRAIETYLCQKNEGHLIRIVGPAFERVCGWAVRGVPLKVAFRGIDRCCERQQTKPGRRRPVRIEFCEADVLDAFDDWRRAIGIVAAADGGDEPAPVAKRAGLAAHIERRLERLRARAEDASLRPDFRAGLLDIVGDLAALGAEAANARGEKRTGIVAALADLDRRLVERAVTQLDDAAVERLRREAAAELAPFAGRMTAEAFAAASTAAFHRLAREAAAVPALGYE